MKGLSIIYMLHIAYHLLKEIGGVDIIGPILLGLKKQQFSSFVVALP